jgi:hypothetical protein
MASTYLTRTFSSSGTSDKIWTWSSWIKRSEVTGEAAILTAGSSARDFIRFEASTTIGALRVRFSNGSADVTTNRRFRDTSGWYHLVVAVDTTQATASNRIKIYINGVQETSFSSSSYPSQNYVTKIGGGYVHNIGNDSEQTVPYFDGSMSHVHFIDGTAYDASAFGEYDANGVWKIKTSPSVTYGTNGFFILKDGNSVTDQSGEGNNFTVGGGTLTNTEDSPSNVFATFNPLAGYYNGSTFSNGNNTVVTGTTQYSYDRATLGASSGKYYWEIQYAGRSGGSIPYSLIGISSTQPKSTTDFLGKYSYDWAYYVTSSSKIMNASTETSYGTTYGDNDIIGVAMDLDNYKLYFSKNGTWQNSGDPTSGSTGTGAISIVNPSTASYGIDTPLGAYFPAVSFYDGGVSGTYKANFGNGYFGTTAVSSAGTNASGIGIFEYDVPTGYTALSTKGLNL